MFKIDRTKPSETSISLVCDYCKETITFADVVAFRTDENGNLTAESRPVFLHNKCCQAATGEGYWEREPIIEFLKALAARTETPEEKRRDRRYRAIIRTVEAAGAEGATVRDVQTLNKVYSANELRQHMDELTEAGILFTEDTKARNGRAVRRYFVKVVRDWKVEG